jgi:hypothetical protein
MCAMPEVHVPKTASGKSLFKIVLEVSLISLGVFLGLMGEQWRERSEHHELAMESLRRFQRRFGPIARRVPT